VSASKERTTSNREILVAADQTVTSPFVMSFERSGGAAIIAATQIWDTSKPPAVCVDHQEFDKQSVNPDTRKVALPVGTYICVFDSSGTPNLNGTYSFVFAINGVAVDTAQGDCAAIPGLADRHDQCNLHVK
jgi:hypothetical protein